LRRATVEQYRAQYDETVANYREAVLTAFQQVEDNLAIAANPVRANPQFQERGGANRRKKTLAIAHGSLRIWDSIHSSNVTHRANYFVN
jgi:hypothetical protein